MSIVVDTSVIIAVLKDEPGAADGERMLRGGLIGTPTFVEAVTRGEEFGIATADTIAAISAWKLQIVGLDRAAADQALSLWPLRKRNVSLGDRLCIGLARSLGLPVLTGDRGWKTLELGVEVKLFR